MPNKSLRWNPQTKQHHAVDCDCGNCEVAALASKTESIWCCKIGGLTGELPKGADLPMRIAIRNAYRELTGVEPQFLFSGWGQELTEAERAVVENREPRVTMQTTGSPVETSAPRLGMDTPWPLHDVVAKLIEATQHLLDHHQCDVHGHEEFRTAANRGHEYLAALRSPAETSRELEPEDDPANLEIVAKLKAAFAGDPDARHLTTAMAKLADGAIEPDTGVAILTHKECDAIGKELRRLVRSARETPAKLHPYLVEATRFKMSFDSKGRVNSFAGFEKQLDGVWVALVYANDDAHMRGYSRVKASRDETGSHGNG
jgi:hypothetical protein